MNTVIELNDVSLTRGESPILRNVSWRTQRQEQWVVLGANGAGKTSLVRVASGRIAPSSGEALFDGVSVEESQPQELAARCSLVSLSSTQRLRASTSVIDVVRSAAWGVSSPFGEEYEDVDTDRAHDLLALFSVSHLADRPFHTLSEGERQRIVLARGLMSDPEVLILDEPTAGLDLGARELLIAAIDEIISGPAAPQVVLVTHHLEEIPQGITHALVMKDGEAFAAGPIDEVLTGRVLSDAFELALSVENDHGRWLARGLPR